MLMMTKYSKIFTVLLFVVLLLLSLRQTLISIKSCTTFHGLTKIIQQSNQSGDTSFIRKKRSAHVRVHLPSGMKIIAGQTFKYSNITNKLYV